MRISLSQGNDRIYLNHRSSAAIILENDQLVPLSIIKPMSDAILTKEHQDTYLAYRQAEFDATQARIAFIHSLAQSLAPTVQYHLDNAHTLYPEHLL